MIKKKKKGKKPKQNMGVGNLPNGHVDTTVGTNMHFREKKYQENKSVVLQ